MPPRTLLISMYASIGKVATLAVPAAANQAILGMEFDATITTRFIYYWLQHVERNLVQFSSSNTQENLNAAKVRAIPVFVPPAVEQSYIAAFLDRETAKIDALVAEQERLIALLKEKRQAAISHAVTKGFHPEVPMKDSDIELIGEVPSHWEMARLKYLVTSNSGIQMGPFGGMLLDLDSEVTGFKVYGQENTISGDFSRGSRWISGPRYHELANYHVTNGDLLLTRKGSLGNARLIEDLAVPGIIDSDTIRIRVDTGVILPQFLVLLLHESRYIGEQIGLAKRGAILPGLNTETIANLIVALPPLHEQESLLRELEQVTVAIDRQCEDCMSVVDLLRERRSALITAAITGQIDVRGLAPAEAA